MNWIFFAPLSTMYANLVLLVVKECLVVVKEAFTKFHAPVSYLW